VGRTTGLFLLDTGAAATALDSRFAAAARLALGQPVAIEGRGGDVGAHQAQVLRLTLTGGPGADIAPVVTDLSDASRAMRTPLAGILGNDFLQRFVLILDYRAGMLTVTSDAQPPADAVPIRFSQAPFVVARVTRGGRTAQGEFEVDTGSNTAIEFWRPFARDALGGARGAADVGLGVAGETVIERGRIDTLAVAGQTIEGLDVNLADDTRPPDAGKAYAGVIGGPAWKGRVLILDLPHRRMWLR
jgi:hypothetical protein